MTTEAARQYQKRYRGKLREMLSAGERYAIWQPVYAEARRTGRSVKQAHSLAKCAVQKAAVQRLRAARDEREGERAT